MNYVQELPYCFFYKGLKLNKQNKDARAKLILKFRSEDESLRSDIKVPAIEHGITHEPIGTVSQVKT